MYKILSNFASIGKFLIVLFVIGETKLPQGSVIFCYRVKVFGGNLGDFLDIYAKKTQQRVSLEGMVMTDTARSIPTLMRPNLLAHLHGHEHYHEHSPAKSI
jgi:hypothetical protein